MQLPVNQLEGGEGDAGNIGIWADVLLNVEVLEQPQRPEQEPPSLYWWIMEFQFIGLICWDNSERVMIDPGTFTTKWWSVSAIVKAL